MTPNALVQLQARYNHCGEAASEKCLSAATFVRPLARRFSMLALIQSASYSYHNPATPRALRLPAEDNTRHDLPDVRERKLVT
jgi:hypothetical protein